MRLDLDAKVQTRDGEDAGTLQWAIVDPKSNEVTHLVVSTGVLFGRAVEVPREEIEQASEEGDSLRLRLTRDELEALPVHAPARYETPPAGWIPPAAHAFPLGSYRWPAPVLAATADPIEPKGEVVAPEEMERIAGPGKETPPGREDEIGIGKGAAVVDKDGETIGVVDELYFQEGSGQLRGFTLRVGGMLRTLLGGGDEVEVPAHHVSSIGESTVYLDVTKDDVAAMRT